MDDPVFASVRELADGIRRREVSATEILEAHLVQISRHNAALQAVVTVDEEGARARAREADAALTWDESWGPLHGVPITLEDCHATSGVRSTWGGLPRLAEHIPEDDGTVAGRLKGAGAILVGKTNGPELGPDSVFPGTNNPWDLGCTPGESSSGPAAAVAAGLTPLDVGLDSLGSLQNPAHYCGVYGMRPTEHRIPLTGAFFVDPVRKFRIMSVTGPMARSCEDLRLALHLLCGPDGLDTHVPPTPWRDVASPAVGDLRVAWASGFPGSETQDEIRAAVERLARGLISEGATVEERVPDVDLAYQGDLGMELFDIVADTFSSERDTSSEASSPEHAGHNPLEVYMVALESREEIMRSWERFFSGWDVLVMPAGTNTAERHEDVPMEPSPLEYPYALSPVSGCPMVVVPAGVDRAGLPFGLQMLGRRWDDERLLAIVESLSEMTGGFRRPPGY